MLSLALQNLVNYGIEKNLIGEEDRIYVINRFLDILGIDEYTPSQKSEEMDLETILKIILDDAVERGFIEDSIVYKDLLDTKLMGAMIPFPKTINDKFQSLYKISPKDATDWYYNFSCDSDYIRRYRIKNDIKWKVKTKYGELDITINLAKPEKDPKAIAAAKNIKSTAYPKCLLCKETQGHAGNINIPARQNHRILPISIGNKDWFFQYSPYVYYNEHCILLSGEHEPMQISDETFSKMFDFLDIVPHYFVGSNADLPIVGGSILSHDHFQGGNYLFAMEKAKVLSSYKVDSYENVSVETLDWPMSVIRLTAGNRKEIQKLAGEILSHWRGYTNEKANIFAYTKEPHNTITPIARKVHGRYQIDLVLRNNITSDEHPLGVYHPHSHLHHIKKENIGLIEVMGLAVLPSRLKNEIETLKKCILSKTDVATNEEVSKHSDWIAKLLAKHNNISAENIDTILKEEIGIIFEEVLECAGVFKRNQPYFEQYMADFIAKRAQ